ncbi:two-component sensor histidine kinase [Nocardia yunnanensis]|uniref:histidine kinase n=1 Tax=Nocardia yunnanensis TaxID=2382165 RepID=A0A386ZPC5_9NOCA|nr:histidine kinase [Nocardia yunnanensis]AYF79213.1 two-component sensor histidine kinase [Nocardia yunnanensis]
MIDLRDRATRWTAARWLPLLGTPVLLAASTFPGEYRVPAVYWLLAVAAGLVFAVGGRHPLVVSLVLSGLAGAMFVIPAWGPSELVPYLGAVALVEAVMRAGDRAAAAATLAWGCAWVAGHWGGHDPAFWRGATFVAAAAYVGLPLLAGLWLRGQRRLTASLAARASEAQIRARAEERAALARELHDLVAHHMASIVVRVKVADRVLGDTDPRVREVLDDVGDTASGALTDIRRLLAALRDPVLDGVPLLDASVVRAEIDGAVERVRQGGFDVDATIDTHLDGLDAIARLTLLRLVQESLTNVMKHADRRTRVRIVVARTDSGVHLAVTNRSRDTHRATSDTHGSGHGLAGMRERVVLVGGRLETAAREHDWVLEAWLPATSGEIAAAPTASAALADGVVWA